MGIFWQILIVIYLQDILCLLKVDDGLIKPIAFLKAFSKQEVIVRYLNVTIIVSATLDHITQGLFIYVDCLLFLKYLQKI